ncbi:dnaJ homolog subfamily C member 30, mitochondrial [Conger conger]|uniref:dnaJ homolog subfamily C member 30, mitochondrial n=1 Tax=Conger conger TaxID=82655 RepID=UPI002A5AF5D1|nr:dnaJ homolog subfamily C member 30, mitochondrial [Conger conger]
MASSLGKQKNVLTAAVLVKNHGICAQKRRSLSTIMLTERERSHRSFLQRSRGEVMSSVHAYMRNSPPDPPPYQSKTAYYDILQVSTNATHAQIKTAYYKQSFIYHPDKNAGSEEATKRFSEITEAYNVLGNKSLKKKYDRGILSHADVQGASRPSAKEAASSRTVSQPKSSQQSPTVGMSGKSVFDFDAFYKAHYGEQLQREKDLRQRRVAIKKDQDKPHHDFLVDAAAGFLLFMTVIILVSLKV